MADLFRAHVQNLSLAERINVGLNILIQHSKKTGGAVDVRAKFGFFAASIPADKDLDDAGRDALEGLGWSRPSQGGDYNIYLEE